MTVEEIRKRFQHARAKSGLSYREIYEKTGITMNTMYRWEGGAGIRLETLVMLLDALGYELEVKREQVVTQR